MSKFNYHVITFSKILSDLDKQRSHQQIFFTLIIKLCFFKPYIKIEFITVICMLKQSSYFCESIFLFSIQRRFERVSIFQQWDCYFLGTQLADPHHSHYSSFLATCLSAIMESTNKSVELFCPIPFPLGERFRFLVKLHAVFKLNNK